MLPPVEDTILVENPNFATLYTSLQSEFLCPDGTTKFHAAQKERKAVTEALELGYRRAAKSHLLQSALGNLDISPAPTATLATARSSAIFKQHPSELVESIILLSSILRHNSVPLSSSSTKLLETSILWTSISSQLPQIGVLLSSHLQTQAIALCRISNPNSNASFLHRAIPKLVSTVEARQKTIKDKSQELDLRRVLLVGKVRTLLSLHHHASELVINHLEQVMYGSVARRLKIKSEYLGLTAQQLELEATSKYIRGYKMVYTDDVKSALSEYRLSLHDSRERLKEKKRELEKILEGYGFGQPDGEKKKIMQSIADKHVELDKECKEVRRDIEKLKRK
ncbi:unnamed protein product [Blumeria hordei]|uniref:Uncharacterized protein n=1 Tax=Blumeria hordei TaxID=2867405 RepID=A0A383USE0_BLUHO|nr:unnamed protein product [Blumeria hordei]